MDGRHFKVGTAFAEFSLSSLGEWAEALEEYAAAIASATRNANYHYLQWLLAQKAWLHFQAMDFKGVRAICESALSLTRNSAPRPAPDWPIGFPRQVRNALICSALASVALRDYA